MICFRPLLGNILSLVALILLVLCLFAGSSRQFLPDATILRIDTSSLSLNNAPDFFNIYLMSYCYGFNKECVVDDASKTTTIQRSIEACSDLNPFQLFDPGKAILDAAGNPDGNSNDDGNGNGDSGGDDGGNGNGNGDGTSNNNDNGDGDDDDGGNGNGNGDSGGDDGGNGNGNGDGTSNNNDNGDGDDDDGGNGNGNGDSDGDGDGNTQTGWPSYLTDDFIALAPTSQAMAFLFIIGTSAVALSVVLRLSTVRQIWQPPGPRSGNGIDPPSYPASPYTLDIVPPSNFQLVTFITSTIVLLIASIIATMISTQFVDLISKSGSPGFSAETDSNFLGMAWTAVVIQTLLTIDALIALIRYRALHCRCDWEEVPTSPGGEAKRLIS